VTTRRGARGAARRALGEARYQRARNDVQGQPAHRWRGGQGEPKAAASSGCAVAALVVAALAVVSRRGLA